MASQELTKWNSGLFDCCDDTKSCCYGFWCCPCFACSTAGKFGENSCLPLCDMLTPAITAAFGIPLCVPPAAVTLRVAIRHKYGIKDTLCNDIVTSCFCGWCSWCQMAREIKYRKKAAKAAKDAKDAKAAKAAKEGKKTQSDKVIILQNQVINQPNHMAAPPPPTPTNPAHFFATPTYRPAPAGFVGQPGVMGHW